MNLAERIATSAMFIQTGGKCFAARDLTIGQVSHANIVQIHAAGQWQGLYYIALEYVEGRNLRDYLAKKGPPTVLQALSIMRQVASALVRAGFFLMQ